MAMAAGCSGSPGCPVPASRPSRTRSRALHTRGVRTFILDGDSVRHGLTKDLGFTPRTGPRTCAGWPRSPNHAGGGPDRAGVAGVAVPHRPARCPIAVRRRRLPGGLRRHPPGRLHRARPEGPLRQAAAGDPPNMSGVGRTTNRRPTRTFTWMAAGHRRRTRRRCWQDSVCHRVGGDEQSAERNVARPHGGRCADHGAQRRGGDLGHWAFHVATVRGGRQRRRCAALLRPGAAAGGTEGRRRLGRRGGVRVPG